MSLSVALFNAVSGLRLNQAALDVTAQNVANVNTEGYSRKIIHQEAQILGGVGAGVQIIKISRKVNEFIVKDMRDAMSQVSDSRAQEEFYTRMQVLFGSPQSDSSLSAFITDLASRFQSLVNAPEDVTLQTQVVNQADLLAKEINNFATRIQDMRLAADRNIADAVNEVQVKLGQIHDLNIKIAENLAFNLPASDLEDRRDVALNAVSKIIGIKYFTRDTGEIVVMSDSGRMLIDRTKPTLTHNAAAIFNPTMTYTSAGGPIDGINLNGTDITSEITTGSLAGLVAMRDTVLPDLASQIEELAGTLQNEINALHNKGTAYPGSPGMTGTRTMIGTDRPVWTGTFRIAVLDGNAAVFGAPVSYADLNLAGITDVTALVTAINGNANLTGRVTAAINASGKVTLTPVNPANRIALNEMTSAVTIGNRTVGAATFLGLNDLFSNSVDYDAYASDYQTSATTALGLAGTLTFRVGAAAIGVAYIAGDTMAGIATKITAALAAQNITAAAVTDGSGFRLRITADTSVGANNFFVTDSNPNGVVKSLNVTVRDGTFASSMSLRSDIKADPSRIAHATLSSAVLAAGNIAVARGDNSAVQSIANRFNTNVSFASTGLLAASNRKMADYAAQVLALNSTQARNVSDIRLTRQFLVESLTNSAAAVAGVNLDEEMANMIVLENAYAASARVIAVTSRLFELLTELAG